MSTSTMQCFCTCGRRSVIPGDVRAFTCECGRQCEVDWSAEMRERQTLGAERQGRG